MKWLFLLLLWQPLAGGEPPRLTVKSEPQASVRWQGLVVGETDALGQIQFSGMPLGIYRVAVAKAGFQSAERQIAVVDGTQELVIRLTPLKLTTQAPAQGVLGPGGPPRAPDVAPAGQPVADPGEEPPPPQAPAPTRSQAGEIRPQAATPGPVPDSAPLSAGRSADPLPESEPAAPAATRGQSLLSPAGLLGRLWPFIILLLLGLGIIWFASRRKTTPAVAVEDSGPPEKALEAFSQTLSPSSTRASTSAEPKRKPRGT